MAAFFLSEIMFKKILYLLKVLSYYFYKRSPLRSTKLRIKNPTQINLKKSKLRKIYLKEY